MLEDVNVDVLLCADNAVLLPENPNDLQRILSSYYGVMKTMDLKSNVSKRSCVNRENASYK